ncbi:unnamed protein product [Somion occarium]|uniref:FAD-binding domain-containing protein n=1 Tax=Somion occarium TaxID=3059160 RepID=A0ABP1DJF0_9APHY
MPTAKLRVAICGGGIGGLALAVALSKYSDIQVDVYEAAGQFKEIGAGVMMWERTWKILDQLGLSEDLSKAADTPPNGFPGIGFDFRRADRETGFQFHMYNPPYGCIRFHRAHFLDVFVNHLPSGVAHFGKRLLSYEDRHSNSQVILKFADGSQGTCDLLVGCDGLKSTVRKQMYDQAPFKEPTLKIVAEPIWSGWVTYRALVPADRVRQANGGKETRTTTTPMMYCGKSKHIVSYPIFQGRIVNVVGLVFYPEGEGKTFDGPWVTECDGAEVIKHYVGWEQEVQDLLRHVDKAMLWAVHSLRPLPMYTSGRVALLGDAAHAMTPHQGAGAGQAIEDAYILAALLGEPSITALNLWKALSAYESIRLPFANRVLRESAVSGKMYEFNSIFQDNYTSLGPAIDAQWSWLWESTPEEEVERALKRMRGLGVKHKL